MEFEEQETDFKDCHYYEPDIEDFCECPGNIFILACRHCPYLREGKEDGI
jgi:hypothetical protein